MLRSQVALTTTEATSTANLQVVRGQPTASKVIPQDVTKTNSKTPFASLPRLKMTLAAFWTVGCRFEGQQVGLSEAWFAIYPAIALLVLMYFSLLNLLAKAVRRRMSDVLFAPTVLALCLMHYYRLELAASGWLAGIDGRVPTLVFSDEVQKLQLADYFTTDIAWRMNGRVKLLFATKLAILGANLLPLMLARPFPIVSKGADLGLHGVEKALGLRARHVGGLGRSLTYIVAAIDTKERKLSSIRTAVMVISPVSDRSSESHHTATTMVTPVRASVGRTGDKPNGNDVVKDSVKLVPPSLVDRVAPREIALVNSYELIRLGYLIFGDQYLITFDEWDLLSSMAPFRGFCHFWNHRVLVWTLRDVKVEGDAEIAGGRALASTDPQMWRLDDVRLQKIRWWQVSACGIQC
ncbi:hypothetical protein BBJ28_00024354 [Nothophytophthora sp. Chile5]|nr:hypothetical protein BBJ28_00024354 [Nothophytophthora sp. Chile5]